MTPDHPELDELEALAMGEVGPERAAAIQAHAASCADCAAELKLLRAERALMKKRAQESPPLPADLWSNVEARISAAKVISFGEQRRRRRHWTLLGAATAVAAAAALALVIRPGPSPLDGSPDASTPIADDETQTDPEATAALDRAERDYASAMSMLESKLDAKTARKLQPVRARLADARTAAASDVNARMRVLSSYSAYLRSLQRAVDSEEAAP